MAEAYYYKVVYVNEEGIYSSAKTYGDLGLKYSIGEVTTPKMGKVFIFKKLEDAKTFRSWQGKSYIIVKVEVIGNVAKCEARLERVNDFTSDTYIKLFWESSKIEDGKWNPPTLTWWHGMGEQLVPMKDYLHWITASPPEGSYIADAVRPIEIV